MTDEEIEAKVIEVLNEMTQDWDLEPSDGIGRDTGLMGDLAFESIDIVQLAVALEKGFGKQSLPFEQLVMRDGDYVDEVYVRNIVDFMSRQIQ